MSAQPATAKDATRAKTRGVRARFFLAPKVPSRHSTSNYQLRFLAIFLARARCLRHYGVHRPRNRGSASPRQLAQRGYTRSSSTAGIQLLKDGDRSVGERDVHQHDDLQAGGTLGVRASFFDAGLSKTANC